MDEEEKTQLSAADRIGVTYGIKLSYAAVEKSTAENKRDILYSLTCFGCMFDDSFAKDPDPVVTKHKCLQAPEPTKLDLYELAYTVVTLPELPTETAFELRKMWYFLFAYVLLGEAPQDPLIYDELCTLLHTEAVFKEVLAARYSVYIPATTEEMRAIGTPQHLIDWYAPYLSYCTERDEKGVTRETAECKRLLALGRFEDALLRSERLLSAFPDDLQIALSNVAARVSLSGVTDAKSRTALLQETLSIVDDYLCVASDQYFRYYRGLVLLGLMDTVGARAEFTLCLQNDPSFEPAMLMLRGLEKYEK